MAGTESGAGEKDLTEERMNEGADGALGSGDREPDNGADGGNKSVKRQRTHSADGEDKKSVRADSVSCSVASTGNDLRANAPKSKEARLYWVKFTPADKQNWTPAQGESAIKITSQDLIGCAVLILTELQCEDNSFPDRFAQAGVMEQEVGSGVLELSAAFTSAAHRDKFISHAQGCMNASPSESADDDEAQVLYTIAKDDAVPEMAFALLRHESTRLSVFTLRSPYALTPSMITAAVSNQTSGLMIVTKARYSYERDEEGRPMKSIGGTKPVFHLRVKRTKEKLHLPGVFTINSYPYRYSLEEGHIDACKICHQPHQNCECLAVKADLQRALDFKKSGRDKAIARKEAKQARKDKGGSSNDAAPRDERAEMLAKRGNKGKAIAGRRTDVQKSTTCRNFLNGFCKYGNRCSFSHAKIGEALTGAPCKKYMPNNPSEYIRKLDNVPTVFIRLQQSPRLQ